MPKDVRKSILPVVLVLVAMTLGAVIACILLRKSPEPALRSRPAEQPVLLRLQAPPPSIRLMSDVADRAVLDEFLRNHPEIEVEPWTQLKMNGPRGEATFYMAMAGEQAPDALYVYERSLQKYINQEFLYPLNEYLEGENSDDPLMQKFFQRQDVLEATSRGDKIYAIPTVVNVHALLYRKDLFKAEGLDPEKPPTTWEELMVTARKLTHEQAGQYGFMIPSGSGAGWRMSNFVWQAGGEVTRRLPDGSWRFALGDPRLIEVYPTGSWRLVAGKSASMPASAPATDDKRSPGARFLDSIDAKKVEVNRDGQWRVVRDEANVLKFYQMADGTWLLDKLGPDRPFSKDWTPDGFEQWKRRHIDTEELPGVRALGFWKDMRWGKYKDKNGKEVQGCMRVESGGWNQEFVDFQQGKTVMMVLSTQGGNVGSVLESLKLDPTQVGLAPLPAGPELDYPDPNRPNDVDASVKKRQQAAMLEGEYWGINNLIAKDKDRRDAAWKYIRFQLGLLKAGEKPPERTAKQIRTRTYVEAGWALSVNPVWLKTYGYEAELRRMPDAWKHLYEDIFLRSNAQLEPYAPGYDQTMTDMLSKVDDVLQSEDGDPAATIRTISDDANKIYFMTTPPEVVQHRQMWADSIFKTLMAIVLGVIIWKLVVGMRRYRARRKAAVAHGPIRTQHLHSNLTFLAWCFMVPALVTILVWNYVPLVRGAALAFMDYRILGASHFVWLDNFIEAFAQGGLFWQSFGQTLIYVTMAIVLGFPAPIVLAFILSEIPRGSLFFRTVFYLPAVTSGLVVMFLWKMMYDDSEQGVFNQGLIWLTSSDVGRVVLIATLMTIWLVMLALLGSITSGLLSRGENRRPWIAMLLLVLTAPFWAGWVLQVVGGVMLACGLPSGGGLMNHQFLGQWFDSLGLRLPLTFVTQGVLRMLIGLVTAASLWTLLRRWLPRAGTLGKLVFGLPLAVAGASLGIHIFRLITPMEQPYQWLLDSSGYWPMLWIIVPGIWAGIGPGCILYLAAIKSIPEDLYEAADVDGAGPLDKCWHITVQYLKPLLIINFVGVFVGTFHAMQNVLVMTGGGPSSKTMTIGMDIFFNAFTHLKFGYATAEAWILGSLLIGFTVYQLRILKRLRFTRTGQ